jgi:hypothetical protein
MFNKFDAPNAAHHPTPGQQDTLQLQAPLLAHDL